MPLQEPEASRRRFTFRPNISRLPARRRIALRPSSKISAAAPCCATETASCRRGRYYSGTLTLFLTLIGTWHSTRFTAIWTTLVLPIAVATVTGDTCGQTRASRAERTRRPRRYRDFILTLGPPRPLQGPNRNPRPALRN